MMGGPHHLVPEGRSHSTQFGGGQEAKVKGQSLYHDQGLAIQKRLYHATSQVCGWKAYCLCDG